MTTQIIVEIIVERIYIVTTMYIPIIILGVIVVRFVVILEVNFEILDDDVNKQRNMKRTLI
jgi:flagellar biosynthesis protein FliQ